MVNGPTNQPQEDFSKKETPDTEKRRISSMRSRVLMAIALLAPGCISPDMASITPFTSTSAPVPERPFGEEVKRPTFDYLMLPTPVTVLWERNIKDPLSNDEKALIEHVQKVDQYLKKKSETKSGKEELKLWAKFFNSFMQLYKFSYDDLFFLSEECGIEWWKKSVQKSKKTRTILFALKELGVNTSQQKNEAKGIVRIVDYVSIDSEGFAYQSSLEDFREDETFQVMRRVIRQFPEWHTEDVVDVARYLHQKNEENASASKMKKAKEIIERVRKHHENVEVIGPGRGVSVIAHQELHSSKSVKYAQITVPKGRSKLTFPEAGERRFGRPHLLQQIEKVTNKSVDGSFLAPGFNPSGATPVEAAKNIEALAELKKRILKHIVDAPPGHTFLFDGHGGAKAFGIGYLQNPSAKATESTKKCSLTVEDMVSALKKRYEKHKDHHELLATDVFIFNSCVSGTFIELIREQLHFPQDAFILISAAEKGLLTKSDFNSQTGDALWDDVLGLKDENPKAVKLGDIIQRDRKKVIGSNLRIIVPLSLESEERKGKKSQEPEYLQIGRAELTNSQEEGKKAA